MTGDGGETQVRLLPWTGARGGPCLLLTGGDGPVSRLADRIENEKPRLADRLSSRARDDFGAQGTESEGAELGFPALRLADALASALLITRSGDTRCEASRQEPPPGEQLSSSEAEAEAERETSPCMRPVERWTFGLLSLPGTDLASASAARRYVRDMARSWGLTPDAVDGLETVVGELAANALEHSDSDLITVTLVLAAAVAIVSVTDAGPGREAAATMPLPRMPGHEEERGRGLLITEALAARWGRRWMGNGLTVWAELVVESPGNAVNGLPRSGRGERSSGSGSSP
ncbi:ATP-binding protein [Streptomyces ipomoeae]|uniref:ATP-binding protein n=1 Tax=Streptomyces ipomoeae TaxID=103232 RepID=UPI0029B3C66D|nr:ATP-binding protein [Streptomyces ipomoeae]MDX2825418.1 ATP-binding protein [Streptomyces ipomoeae]MDX2878026.1 ATP-binding protein [Streptomyces ipomoeae]